MNCWWNEPFCVKKNGWKFRCFDSLWPEKTQKSVEMEAIFWSECQQNKKNCIFHLISRPFWHISLNWMGSSTSKCLGEWTLPKLMSKRRRVWCPVHTIVAIQCVDNDHFQWCKDWFRKKEHANQNTLKLFFEHFIINWTKRRDEFTLLSFAASKQSMSIVFWHFTSITKIYSYVNTHAHKRIAAVTVLSK